MKPRFSISPAGVKHGEKLRIKGMKGKSDVNFIVGILTLGLERRVARLAMDGSCAGLQFGELSRSKYRLGDDNIVGESMLRVHRLLKGRAAQMQQSH